MMPTRRAGCVERRLSGSTEARGIKTRHGANCVERISAFYPMRCPGSGATEKSPALTGFLPVGAGPSQSKVVRPPHGGQIPPRGSDHKSRLIGTTRVQVSTGSFNVGRRGELPRPKGPEPGCDQLGDRVSGESRLDKPDGEKLNHERPARACRSLPAKDGAELRMVQVGG